MQLQAIEQQCTYQKAPRKKKKRRAPIGNSSRFENKDKDLDEISELGECVWELIIPSVAKKGILYSSENG